MTREQMIALLAAQDIRDNVLYKGLCAEDRGKAASAAVQRATEAMSDILLALP